MLRSCVLPRLEQVDAQNVHSVYEMSIEVQVKRER
ncbi:hypothetical protein SMD44_p10095 (plasmid) [Streptomyces alboflavus]|uniref:Uncharacterized protein n=1 Tax=Streptomyces alboflavus TaxID=67267 RepID=A0A291W3L7_9ACTN|nr:hypothetical protein SMD44_p10095 [Streptomyces alboflavus]